MCLQEFSRDSSSPPTSTVTLLHQRHLLTSTTFLYPPCRPLPNPRSSMLPYQRLIALPKTNRLTIRTETFSTSRRASSRMYTRHIGFDPLLSYAVFLIRSNPLSLEIGSFCLILGLAGVAYDARISETLRPTSSHSYTSCAKYMQED